MSINDTSTIYILIIINFIIFIIGYLIGKNYNNIYHQYEKPKSFFDNNLKATVKTNSININDKKFVVDIKTNDLEKKYDSLGEIKKTSDNISNSVNKLKNLKR